MKVVPLKGHEMSPSILDLTINPNVVQLKIRFSIEAMLAEIDLSEVSDTNLSENAIKYDGNKVLDEKLNNLIETGDVPIAPDPSCRQIQVIPWLWGPFVGKFK